MNDPEERLRPWIAALRRLPEPRTEALTCLRAALHAEYPHSRRLVLTLPAAVAAAVAVAALTSAFWLALWTVDSAPSAGMAGEFTPTQFVLHARNAHTVSIVGDFNDWDPHATPLTETGDGLWSVVVPLPPGVVTYSFLVDGNEWRADPHAAAVHDDFGRPSSVTFIGRRGTGT